MPTWQVVLTAATFLALPFILFRLHRMLLRWEDRGWIYYNRKKPESGAASSLSVLQQAIEPGHRHVAQIGLQLRADASHRDRVLDRLVSLLAEGSINCAEIQDTLRGVQFDWEELYAEAVRRASECDANRARILPRIDEIAPGKLSRKA